MYNWEELSIDVLIGKTITEIKTSIDKIVLICADDTKYIMYHEQDCCENVYVEDICGDISDLIGSPILKASEDTNGENPKTVEGFTDESNTWTFYNLATIKGYVTIRWYGSSNGYYSERITIKNIT